MAPENQRSAFPVMAARSPQSLDTQYGGGKTHGLIVLVHAVQGMKGVKNPGEFVDPILLPREQVRVAALVGENSDPADGLTLQRDLRA